jgi:tight adherence protein C
MLLQLLGLVVLVAAGALIYLLRGGGDDVMARVAALDAASGVDKDNRSMFDRVMDKKRAAALGSRLQEAGWYNVTVQMMVRRSIAGFAIGAAAGLAVMYLARNASVPFMVISAAIAGYGAYYPTAQLAKAVEQRKLGVHRELPNFLDILATTVDAGVALNAALTAAVEQISGPLQDELNIALQDIRLGRSRADALLATAQRVREQDLTTVMIAIVQAERLGTGISKVLMDLAVEMREKRFMRAEELAAQLSTKLVFPVGLCMMPALMLMIFGALIAKLVGK